VKFLLITASDYIDEISNC